MASGHIQKNISMGLSHFYDIVLALQMITCVLCLVASEGKYLQYIYIYSERETLCMWEVCSS